MATKSSRPQDLQEKAEGPQVLLSKSHLYMENYSGTPASNDLIVTNTGTSAVFYEWKKYPRSDSIKSKRPDIVTRFYCHYSKGMLLPGESKRFLFTFISKKVGIFTEAWDLHTDPLVVKAIPQLILTGRAFEPDKMIAQRYFFEQEFNKRIVLHTAEEILTDVVRSVRTPTPPPPDLSNSKECQEQFESKNLSDQVWHTDEIILLFRELEQEVRSHLPPSDQTEIQDPWDLKLENLRKLINKLSKPELREDKQKRLNFLIKLSKAKPPTRSLYWPEARKVLVDLTEAVPGISSGLRTELDLEDYRFRLPWELTQEELDKIQKEKNDKEAARAKLAKGKKGKTEDDIGKDRETYKEKLFQLTKHSLIDLLCRGIDEERFIVQWNHLETIQKTKDLPKVLQNTNRLNKHMKNSNIANYELARNKIAPLNTVNLGSLSRKFGLADADLEGKKVMIRVNFNVPLSEEVWEIEEVDVQTDPDLEPIMVHEKHCLLREVVDSRALMEVVPTIRYCLDHLAKCVVIVGTLGPNVGEIREEFSLMPILNFLQEELDNEIQFFEDVDIDNFEEKIEDLPENSIILIENLAFHPCEIGISASRDGVVKHVDLDKIRQYREKLCTYCDIFINEAFDDKHMRNLGNDSCSNVNPGCSSLNFLECGCEGVMGLKLEKEIKVLSSTFFEPEHPFVAMIGGNSQSKLSHLDKLVMSYAFLDVVDVLFIAGDLSQIIQSVQNGHSGHDARLDRFVKLFLNQVQESKKKLILPEDFIYSKEPLVPSESSFSWGHFASLVVPASNDEISAENLKIVGFGEKTREKLEVLLGQSRRFFWCGSLDLHFSDRSEIVPLNKTAVEFFKAHKETKELFVTIQDVESSLLPFFEKEEGRSPEKIEENEGFEEEEQSKSEESAQGESMIVPADNSPEENLEKFFSNRLGLYQFVVDILQAKKVRPVELIKEHPPPKPKSVEEDTSYLEII
jgi:3-phosphoglycerate kinase